MFTGIVEGVGVVRKSHSAKNHRQIWIRAPFALRGTQLGDSIAVDGCCLTVTKLKGREFCADVSPETLRRTTLGAWKPKTEVNLERALRVGDRLGGHMVQGHVDGVGKILSRKNVRSGDGLYCFLEVEIPPSLRPYLIEKGSITVDGISLTVNALKQDRISLCLIPHTQGKTALTAKKPGARVNLEADMLLKYMEKMLKPEYLRAFSQVNSRRKAKRK